MNEPMWEMIGMVLQDSQVSLKIPMVKKPCNGG